MDVTILQTDKFLSMDNESNRVESFHNWPHLDDSKCSAVKMAEAGFFHCPTPSEPDAAQCFVCFKELDGWEPEDDPWEEHRIHSKNCSFAVLGKKQKDLTLEDVFQLEKDRHINIIKLNTQKKQKQYRDEAEEIKKCLRKMV